MWAMSNGGGLNVSSLDHVTPEKAVALDRYRVREGDLLFTRSGTVGRCAVVPREADGWLISYHLLRVALDRDAADPEFVAAAIRGSRDVQRQVLVASKRGSTRDGVNSAFLSGLQVPLPSLATQTQIAGKLRQHMAEAAQAQKAAEAQLAAINALPAALLRRAFSGAL